MIDTLRLAAATNSLASGSSRNMLVRRVELFHRGPGADGWTRLTLARRLD